jgi:uncharacterized membrane protein YfcA
VSLTLIGSLALLGAIGGFAAGLLGFGGGVLMFPLLYYVPPSLGMEKIAANTVASIVMTQVFFSTLAGGMAHLRSGRVHRRIAITAGIVSAIGSFSGGVISKWASERFLLVLFGMVTLIVAAMMLLPGPSKRQEDISIEKLRVPIMPLSVCSLITGTVIGFLGAGNFVFVPLLIYMLKVPTRIAIGSSLFIATMNTATGFLGKLVTGQIPIVMAAVVTLGAVMGALAGEKIHGKVSARMLRYIYAIMVASIAIRVWLTILSSGA